MKIGQKLRKWMKTSSVRHITFFCVAMLFLFLIYIPALSFVKEKALDNKIVNQKVTFDPRILAEIETVSEEKGKLIFSGWALRLDSQKTGVNLVLEEVANEDVLVVDSELTSRPDITAYFDDESKLGEFGFVAKVKARKIKDESCYKIFLSCTYMDNAEEVRTKINLNRYLYNGELYSYNPLSFETPNLTDAELNEVFVQGNVCAYNREKGVWIYEYAGMMYWIFDEKHVPALERRPAIPWSLYTNRGDLVPKDELVQSSRGTYVHYGIYLKESDLVEGNNASYYVIKREIPTEYPVTWIQTGSWSNPDDWVYCVQFQLNNFDDR